MIRNIQANRVCEDWTVIFLQSVLDGFEELLNVVSNSFLNIG